MGGRLELIHIEDLGARQGPPALLGPTYRSQPPFTATFVSKVNLGLPICICQVHRGRMWALPENNAATPHSYVFFNTYLAWYRIAD